MTTHLIKLCVGCESVEHLTEWIERRLRERRRDGFKPEHFHVTRMMPRRGPELLDGGSLYWVIKGSVRARQRLVDIRPFTDADGIRRCRLVLEPRPVETEWWPRRPFQGWRYLRPQDAPADRPTGQRADLPPGMTAELAELGVL